MSNKILTIVIILLFAINIIVFEKVLDDISQNTQAIEEQRIALLYQGEHIDDLLEQHPQMYGYDEHCQPIMLTPAQKRMLDEKYSNLQEDENTDVENGPYEEEYCKTITQNDEMIVYNER